MDLHKLFCLIAIFLCAGIPKHLHADSGTDQLEFTLNPDGKSYSVKAKDGASGHIIIPDIYNGRPVTEIQDFGFDLVKAGNVNYVFLPNSITKINEFAFYGMAGKVYPPLEAKIILSEGVLEIDHWTFAVTPIQEITIPASVHKINGYKLFHEARHLSKIIVNPQNTIYDSRRNCNAIIKTATNTLIAGCGRSYIPESVEIIAAGAFSGDSLKYGLCIPNSVHEIELNAFDQIEIPLIRVEQGNQRYDSRDDCNAIIETNTNILILGCRVSNIPENVKIIGAQAFAGCKIKEIKLPEGITEIAMNAFYNTNLNKIRIPDNVFRIGQSAFSVCSDLSFITLGKAVNLIEKDAFYGCHNIETIICKANMPPKLGDGVFEHDVLNKATLYVPAKSINLYRSAHRWREFRNIETL